MAIQMRRGNAAQYDESKMLAGEFAVAVDSEELYISFVTGNSKKVLTEDDYIPQITKKIWTGRCSTAAATVAKTVTLDNAEGFDAHTAGNTIAVYFVDGNSANYPTLNVNSTGAIHVRRGTSTSGASVNGIDAKWGAGIQFCTYQGGYWIHSSADPVAVSNLANNKADINSPALTGTPTAPTAVSGTDTTQIATTAFVQEAINGVHQTLTATGDGIITLSIQ